MKKNLQWIGIAAAFCLVCLSATVITRNSETLADYAKRKPEIAYAVPKTEITNVVQEPETAESKTVKERNIQDITGTIAPSSSDNTQLENKGDVPMTTTTTQNTDRAIYQPDFYYEPLSDDIKKRITGLSYKENCPIPYDDLRHVRILYINFKGNTSTGELICNKAIAQDLVEIFYELYQANYQIEQIRLVDEYNADDNLSMQDNNSSCFNYRTIAGTDKISMHGQGLAVDINPFFNPYVTYHNGQVQVAPTGAESYVDRDKPFAYKIDENDLCYKLFIQHGFSWGGHWNSSKDYQHFEKKVN